MKTTAHTTTAAPLPQTKDQLLAQLRAQLEADRAYLPTVEGLFVIALLPTDGTCPIHFENTRGVVQFGPYTTAQRYTRRDWAERRMADYNVSTAPAGYTLTVMEFAVLVRMHLEGLEQLIASIAAAPR